MARGELVRLPDWRLRLVSYLEDCARTAFAEGSHDCALFLAGGVEAMTGVDYAADFRGRYQTMKAGLKLLRRAGFKDHVALAFHHLHKKPIAFANEGDGAVVETDGTSALGIVQGARIYVLCESGLGNVPLTDAQSVLRV
ncbi:MAG: hypothetical protein AAGL96_17975 [Pseudomonadota bacterium]